MLMLDARSEDQAAGLRRMQRPRPVRVIAVASGKGGVGKTSISVNMALALAQAGKEVMLLDADLGLANVDVLLGLHPRHTLADVMDGRCSLEEAIVEGPGGIKVVPAASGVQRMAQLSSVEHAGLIRAFSELSLPLDALIVDSAAGISDGVVSFSRAAQDVLVVIGDEPASITDAYAFIKLLSREHGVRRFRVVANMVEGPQQGRQVYEKISRVTDRFLDVSLDYCGHVPSDPMLRRAVQQQRAVVDAYPGSRAARAFRSLAEQTERWPQPSAAGGRLEFFVERLVQARGPGAEVSS